MYTQFLGLLLRRRRLLAVSILALTCLGQPAMLTAQAGSGPRAIGAGGFPVSFIHASAWFGSRSDSSGKDIILMVYFQGAPGWHNHATDYRWEVNKSPASIDMVVGSTPIHIKYWSETSSVVILDAPFRLSNANVFLVENIDGPKRSVKELGRYDLSFASDDNPAIVLLQRNADLRAALSGKPPTESPTPPATKGMEELVAWDAEGLGLLRNEDPADDKKACELFRKAALRGYAASQYRLGYCYEKGQGVKQNEAVANEWYEKAANQGHVDAQYKLGHSYRVGRGTKVNFATAIQWYKKAAESGDAEAMVNVGYMYASGQGVAANPEQAFAWLLRSANSGEPAAQYEVARRLRDGDGVSRDLAAAYVWLLVLQAQSMSFVPDDWKQIQELMQSVERNLSEPARMAAEQEAQVLLRELSMRYIENLGKKW